MKCKIAFLALVAFAILAAPQTNAQHNKDYSSFMKVELKMNYAEQLTDLFIDGSKITNPTKFNAVKNSLTECGAIKWMHDFFAKGEFKIYFYFEPEAKNFACVEFTDGRHETQITAREAFSPTKMMIEKAKGTFPPPDYTPLVDKLYSSLK